jgi:hypothetical protein
MSMRPSRKLHNLNVWQRGIQRYRGAKRPDAAVAEPAAHRGWAKAFFRRLLGRRAAIAKGAAPPSVRAGEGGPYSTSAGSLAAGKEFAARAGIQEGLLSRRVAASGQTASLPRMTQVGTVNVSGARDLRFWQRGKEFVAAACGGFDTGAGAAYAAERRKFWRQRSQRRAAPASRGPAAAATQSLRLLIRSLAKSGGRDEIGPASVGLSTAAGSRKATKPGLRQPVALATGVRRTKTFRDQKLRQRGLRLLEKALRTGQGKAAQNKSLLAMYRPASGWLPGGASKSLDSSGPPPTKQG